MPTLIHRRVAEAREGVNPKTIHRMPSGRAVLGDVQFLRGYSLLLTDPVVRDLNSLHGQDMRRFLEDMTLLGDALLEIIGAERINYDILGNSEPALHAHVFPRYADEPEDLRRGPAFLYDWQNATPFDPEGDGPLMREIAVHLSSHLA